MPPLAHETWFVVDDVPGDWGFAGETLTVVLLAIAVVATIAFRLAARIWPGVDVPSSGAWRLICRSRCASTWPFR